MERLFTRWEHGSRPVTVTRSGRHRVYELENEKYFGTPSLMRALYGHDPGLSHERYFGTRRRGGDLSWLENMSAPKLGIDLDRRGHEVAKLLRKACGISIQRYGYDFQDVLQETYKGILIRNKGKCPWDERKSSFGHYVTMVSECIFRNYHAKQQRRRSRYRVGYEDVSGEASGDVVTLERLGLLVSDFRQWLADHGEGKAAAQVGVEVVEHVVKGMKRSEIASVSGYTPAQVSRATSYIRSQVRGFLSGMG